MARLRLDDTIAAIATAPGVGAVGIVRLSGPAALAIARLIFRPARRNGPAAARSHARDIEWTPRSHRLYHGNVVDPATGRAVDEALLALMQAPRSYTRQDVVEVNCHGGHAAVREVLRLAIAAGARPAEPGEMTLRAFLNGRLDLAQAEGVLAAVQARTAGALAAAVDQLGGGLSRQIGAARAALMDVFAQFEATIDFAEDEVPSPEPAATLQALSRAAGTLRALLATARAGHLQREGVRVALVGRPNAGKSSLLNALLQSDRAIVTPIPGTTRDVIEETIDLDGIPAVLLDTAGIADTADPIERLGVARSRAALEGAGVAVFVLDGSQPLAPADHEIAAALAIRDAPVVVAINKADLPAMFDGSAAAALLPGRPAPAVDVSALAGTGLEHLRVAVRTAALGSAPGALPPDTPLVSSARHRDALERALEHVDDAAAAVRARVEADLVCIHLRSALTALGEITGETVTDDLLATIFSRFCIGK